MPAFGPATPEMKPVIEADRKKIKEALAPIFPNNKGYILHFRCSNKHGHRFILNNTKSKKEDAIKIIYALRPELTYPVEFGL